MGATLANGGVDPKTNEQVVIAEVAWYLLTQLRQTGRQGSRQQGQAEPRLNSYSFRHWQLTGLNSAGNCGEFSNENNYVVRACFNAADVSRSGVRD
jgi:hypothetical protein